MNLIPEDIECYKFSDFAKDIPTYDLCKIKERIVENLANPDTSDAEQLWHEGYIDIMGYRFELPQEYRILVKNTSDYERAWYEHTVPLKDKSLINKYVKRYVGDEAVWIFLNDSDMTVV